MKKEVRKYMAANGRKGGSVKSEAKKIASRLNLEKANKAKFAKLKT